MIEILPGIYYDPSKEWYEQDPQLIELAFQIEQTQPIEVETESSVRTPTQTRILWAVWEHTTEMGLFRMRVDMHYLYDIENDAFLTKSNQNQVSITKILK